MKNRKTIIILIILAVTVLLGGTFFFFLKKRKKTSPETVSIENTRPLTREEKPFLSLVPDALARHLALSVSRVKNEEAIEYELIYELKNGLTRGISGEINLKEGQKEKDVLLGSCSSGTCKYDDDAQKGELNIGLKTNNHIRSFTATFLILNEGEEGESFDHLLKFSLAQKPQGKYIFLENGGLPGKAPEQTIIGGPYSFFSSIKGTVAFRPPAKGKLLYWHNEKEAWETVENFQKSPLGTYLLVSE